MNSAINGLSCAAALLLGLFVSAPAGASSLAPGISGTVFNDFNDDGLISSGELLPGMIMRLYLDDGDSVFNPGGGDILTGAPVVTDGLGAYSFSELSGDAGYFVEQAASGPYLHRASSLIRPGNADLMIDDFNTQMTLSGNPLQDSSSQSIVNSPEESDLGGVRQIEVKLLTGVGTAGVLVNPYGQDNRLVYSTSAGVTGRVQVQWDFAADHNAGNELANIAPIDLTENGERTGLMVRVGVDQAGTNDQMIIRLVGEDPSEVSVALVSVEVTDGFETRFVFVPFSDFVGSADPTSVLGVELELGAGSPSVDASLAEFGVLGPKVQNFAVVPEPAALAWTAVLGAIWLLRRRKREPFQVSKETAAAQGPVIRKAVALVACRPHVGNASRSAAG